MFLKNALASAHPAPPPIVISTSVPPPPVFEAKQPERRNHLPSEEDEQIMRTQLLDFLSKNRLGKDAPLQMFQPKILVPMGDPDLSQNPT